MRGRQNEKKLSKKNGYSNEKRKRRIKQPYPPDIVFW